MKRILAVAIGGRANTMVGGQRNTGFVKKYFLFETRHFVKYKIMKFQQKSHISAI